MHDEVHEQMDVRRNGQRPSVGSVLTPGNGPVRAEPGVALRASAWDLDRPTRAGVGWSGLVGVPACKRLGSGSSNPRVRWSGLGGVTPDCRTLSPAGTPVLAVGCVAQKGRVHPSPSRFWRWRMGYRHSASFAATCVAKEGGSVAQSLAGPRSSVCSPRRHGASAFWGRRCFGPGGQRRQQPRNNESVHHVGFAFCELG